MKNTAIQSKNQRLKQLEKQLEKANKQLEEMDDVVDLWYNEALSYKRKYDLAIAKAEMYESTSNTFCKLLVLKDEGNNKLMDLLSEKKRHSSN